MHNGWWDHEIIRIKNTSWARVQQCHKDTFGFRIEGKVNESSQTLLKHDDVIKSDILICKDKSSNECIQVLIILQLEGKTNFEETRSCLMNLSSPLKLLHILMPKIITSIFFNNIKIDSLDNVLLRDLITNDDNVVLCCKHQNQVDLLVTKVMYLVFFLQDKPQCVSGYEKSMTRLAFQSLRRLQNKHSKQRIVPETMIWAYHWLKNHGITKLPKYSSTPSRDFFTCSTSYNQQTLTQMFDPNRNENDSHHISQLDSLNSQTIQHCILNMQKQLSKLSKKTRSKTTQKKIPSPHINLHLKQTKLYWKPQDIIVQRRKSKPSEQSTKNKKSTTSKWDKYLTHSQLREKYHYRSKAPRNTFYNQKRGGTDLNDLLIQDINSTQMCRKRRSISTTNMNKPITKKQKL